MRQCHVHGKPLARSPLRMSVMHDRRPRPRIGRTPSPFVTTSHWFVGPRNGRSCRCDGYNLRLETLSDFRSASIATKYDSRPEKVTHSPAIWSGSRRAFRRASPAAWKDALSSLADTQNKLDPTSGSAAALAGAACRPPRRDGRQYVLYGRNFPLMTMRTRSPLGSGSRAMCIEKSIALMMPSPNSSWMRALIAVP
jgi:hypothetical protein